MNLNNPLKLAISIVLSQLAGIIGSIFTVTSITTWYSFLNKPFFNPPSWVFGPVWITLYFLMGISFYLIWVGSADAKKKHKAMKIFGVQLFLNTLWSILFFGMHQPWLAFAEILLLLTAIILTIKTFYKINKTAAYLLAPYLLWVSFATILNLAIALLN
ncbi:MAG: tryptophan-rich sensory protein [archaeon]|nr:tryptophan-rich sensory protein [archaeon]